MTSNRPYLIRALYDWILDNELTPHLLVDARRKDAELPVAYVQDGKMVLNISPGAVRGLVIGNDRVSFGARFGGVAMEVSVPIDAVIGVYARENGRGMLFPDEAPRPELSSDDEDPPPPRERPRLKVVK
ncbi:ClpXP protease specificity-enhancing factor [Thioalkalicoccus limnaeus]|uniref:ClpXP protease specificity-enhancing factor n=1 Tax=Thioalkalicoccus limnaeus TaxID=120681 RepID=A0ABV4BMY5_9GAMM